MSAEQPSFNQITDQHDHDHKEATVLVERTGDKISTGRYDGQRLANGNYVVNVTTADGQAGYREVPAAALSDEKQAELAETLAGEPLRDDQVSVETVPREEILAVVESQESLVSEDEREVLGEIALDALNIKAPSDVVETPQVEVKEEVQPETEEVSEAIHDLPEELVEMTNTFLRKGGEEVDSLLGKTTGETNILEEMKNALSALRYGNVENKSQFIQQQMDWAGQLRSAFQQDSESDLRSIVSRFHGELDEAVETIKKEEATTDDLFSKARRLRDASDEIEMSSRSINGQSDDLVAETSALMRTYEDFLNDSWGSETYVALIGHKLNAIEDFLMGRRRSLMRVQSELPTLQSAMK